MQHHDTVIVVAGGKAPDPRVAGRLPGDAPVVAADGGLDHAASLGLNVSLAVGDFDSASPEAVADAGRSGTRIERYPRDKDATDLELALDAALQLDPRRVVVIGDDGGRLDHLTAKLLLLGHEKYQGVELDAFLGAATVHVVRGRRVLAGTPGELVTLLALHGPAEGITTQGLRFGLDGDTLEPGSSRGVSNVFDDGTASIQLERGTLLVVRPGEHDGEPGK